MAKMPEGLWTDTSREALAQHYLRAFYYYWCAAPAICRRWTPLTLCACRATACPTSPCWTSSGRSSACARLIGTALVEQFGGDMTGRYLDERSGVALQRSRMAWCVRERRPYQTRDLITFAPNDFKRYRIIVLPFAAADGSVARLMGGFCFFEDAKSSP